MKARLQLLRAEIKSDRAFFTAHVTELALLHPETPGASKGVLAQTAMALHHSYCAVESLLERIARTFEGELPQGPEWHQDLLASMALDIQDVRPAVLAGQTVQLLRELLAFRHFFRHAYPVPLDGARLARVRDQALQVRSMLDDDLDRFDEFLAKLTARK